MSSSRYIELHARSAFSFLRGACLPEEYVAICSAYAQEGFGAPAMALTDIDGVLQNFGADYPPSRREEDRKRWERYYSHYMARTGSPTVVRHWICPVRASST